MSDTANTSNLEKLKQQILAAQLIIGNPELNLLAKDNYDSLIEYLIEAVNNDYAECVSMILDNPKTLPTLASGCCDSVNKYHDHIRLILESAIESGHDKCITAMISNKTMLQSLDISSVIKKAYEDKRCNHLSIIVRRCIEEGFQDPIKNLLSDPSANDLLKSEILAAIKTYNNFMPTKPPETVAAANHTGIELEVLSPKPTERG